MRLLLLLMLCLVLAACDQTMVRQHKARTNGATDAWPSGQTARPIPDGAVAQGQSAWLAAKANPPKADAALLARGRQRYEIFCAPCHGFDGNGNGPVVQHGYPYPGSLNAARPRAADPHEMFKDISNGTGIMLGYAAEISPRDRWAIIAYIRALQLSQNARASILGPGEKAKLP